MGADAVTAGELRTVAGHLRRLEARLRATGQEWAAVRLGAAAGSVADAAASLDGAYRRRAGR
jgi:hypothetical protein